MERRRISVEDVEAVLANPVHTEIQATKIVYDGVVSERVIRVVVARDSDPVRVITVYPRRRVP
jgi:hypothetical protein